MPDSSPPSSSWHREYSGFSLIPFECVFRVQILGGNLNSLASPPSLQAWSTSSLVSHSLLGSSATLHWSLSYHDKMTEPYKVSPADLTEPYRASPALSAVRTLPGLKETFISTTSGRPWVDPAPVLPPQSTLTPLRWELEDQVH